MTALIGLAVAATVVGVLGLLVLVIQLWAVGSRDQAGVGPWDPPQQPEPGGPKLPSDLLSLWSAEAGRWSRTESEWERLVRRLDGMEQNLGGHPRQGPAPLEYSSAWLDARLDRLEALAGPAPGPRPPRDKL